MIRARVVFDEKACIASIDASGHSGGGAFGENAACAAFSLLFESAFMALSAYGSLRVEGEAKEEGNARFRVRRLSDEHLGEHRGISSFLRAGLAALEQDFPGLVEIDIR
jgi:uncharacterized protein YsxB (DUF464 family)